MMMANLRRKRTIMVLALLALSACGIRQPNCVTARKGGCREIPEKTINGKPLIHGGETSCRWAVLCCEWRLHRSCHNVPIWNSWENEGG